MITVVIVALCLLPRWLCVSFSFARVGRANSVGGDVPFRGCLCDSSRLHTLMLSILRHYVTHTLSTAGVNKMAPCTWCHHCALTHKVLQKKQKFYSKALHTFVYRNGWKYEWNSSFRRRLLLLLEVQCTVLCFYRQHCWCRLCFYRQDIIQSKLHKSIRGKQLVCVIYVCGLRNAI